MYVHVGHELTHVIGRETHTFTTRSDWEGQVSEVALDLLRSPGGKPVASYRRVADGIQAEDARFFLAFKNGSGVCGDETSSELVSFENGDTFLKSDGEKYSRIDLGNRVFFVGFRRSGEGRDNAKRLGTLSLAALSGPLQELAAC